MCNQTNVNVVYIDLQFPGSRFSIQYKIFQRRFWVTLWNTSIFFFFFFTITFNVCVHDSRIVLILPVCEHVDHSFSISAYGLGIILNNSFNQQCVGLCMYMIFLFSSSSQLCHRYEHNSWLVRTLFILENTQLTLVFWHYILLIDLWCARKIICCSFQYIFTIGSSFM